MGSYNYFGATVADAIGRFANGDYTPTSADFGGDSTILPVFDLIEAQLESALGPEVFNQMIFPNKAQLVWRAAQGQTAFQVPACLLPIVAGSMSVWYGSPMQFQLEPRKRSELGTSWGTNDALQGMSMAFDDSRWTSGNNRLYELAIDQFTYNITTGVCALASPPGPMQADQLVYASWQTDVSNALFGLSGPMGSKSLPSLASVMADGVAGIIGGRVYSQADGVWVFVQECRDRYAEAIEQFGMQKRIVSELRLMRWWKPLEKASDLGASSTSRYRG